MYSLGFQVNISMPPPFSSNLGRVIIPTFIYNRPDLVDYTHAPTHICIYIIYLWPDNEWSLRPTDALSEVVRKILRSGAALWWDAVSTPECAKYWKPIVMTGCADRLSSRWANLSPHKYSTLIKDRVPLVVPLLCQNFATSRFLLRRFKSPPYLVKSHLYSFRMGVCRTIQRYVQKLLESLCKWY